MKLDFTDAVVRRPEVHVAAELKRRAQAFLDRRDEEPGKGIVSSVVPLAEAALAGNHRLEVPVLRAKGGGEALTVTGRGDMCTPIWSLRSCTAMQRRRSPSVNAPTSLFASSTTAVQP